MSILDKTVALNEIEAKSVKIIVGEIGAGKTSFHKDMPDACGGDVLYLAVGNDKGFNQLRNDTRFKTLSTGPVKTLYREKNGKKIAIKTRVLTQLTEILEAFRDEEHNFRGLALDAISTVQEQIEMEVRFEKSKNLDWDDWAAIKKAMFRIYEILEEIAEQGYEVSLQTHFQIREYDDAYTGEKTVRLLPLMTENNAIRILKNCDAVVMIKVMPDAKDKKKVHRMSIVGGHPTIPTKIRNENNLSFDGINFENLTYGGLLKLMQVETLEDAADLEGVTLKKLAEGKPKKKKAAKKPTKEEPEVEENEDDEVEEEEVVETKPKKKPTRKSPSRAKKKPTKKVEEEDDEPKTVRKPARKAKQKALEEAEEIETPKKSKPKKRPKKKSVDIEEDELPEVMQDEVEEEEPKKKPRKKPAKRPKKKAPKEEVDELDDDELENDELWED